MCDEAGDKASLAIGMAGLVMDHVHRDRIREASQLASETIALTEAVGDATLTVGLATAAIYGKSQSGEYSTALEWVQRIIELADGDPTKGNFVFGSPLALAFVQRSLLRSLLGLPEWRDDMRHGLALARSADPASHAMTAGYVYMGIPHGVLSPDDAALSQLEDALRMAERSGDDLARSTARMVLGMALVHRQSDAERDRGEKLLAEVSEVFLQLRYSLSDLPIVNVYVARERARRGDRDGAIPLMRAAVDHLFREDQLLLWTISAAGVLVETLWTAPPTAMCPKPRQQSNGWRRHRPTRIWPCATFCCCDYGLSWHGHAATPRLTPTSGIGTATWRKRMASRGISRGPRQCHDDALIRQWAGPPCCSYGCACGVTRNFSPVARLT